MNFNPELARERRRRRQLGIPPDAVELPKVPEMADVDENYTTDDSTSAALIPPDALARDLAEEISSAVEEAVTSPDYQTFESDGERGRYLTQVVHNAHARVYNGVRLRARQAQLEVLLRLEQYPHQLEGRGSKPKPGERMQL
jgi:hypothetical protein